MSWLSGPLTLLKTIAVAEWKTKCAPMGQFVVSLHARVSLVGTHF